MKFKLLNLLLKKPFSSCRFGYISREHQTVHCKTEKSYSYPSFTKPHVNLGIRMAIQISVTKLIGDSQIISLSQPSFTDHKPKLCLIKRGCESGLLTDTNPNACLNDNIIVY